MIEIGDLVERRVSEHNRYYAVVKDITDEGIRVFTLVGFRSGIELVFNAHTLRKVIGWKDIEDPHTLLKVLDRLS